MRQRRFYCEQALQVGGELLLNERNHHYLLHVLRVKSDQTIQLFDGSGAEFIARIIDTGRKSIRVLVESVVDELVENESPLQTMLAIAVSKGERMDWVVQKATELGIHQIQPLITRRVDVKLNGERSEKKQQHWQGIAVAACEQSGRRIVPIVHKPCALDKYLLQSSAELKFVLRAGGESLAKLSEQHKVPTSAELLIGPEGGLDENEISAAEKSGFIATGFGPRVLRTETAPIVALSLLQANWGDF
jgi:16S rRNA (uracil1498-N3)-methyltransferase